MSTCRVMGGHHHQPCLDRMFAGPEQTAQNAAAPMPVFLGEGSPAGPGCAWTPFTMTGRRTGKQDLSAVFSRPQDPGHDG